MNSGDEALESFNRSKVGVSYCTPTPTEKIFESLVYVFDRNRPNLHESIKKSIIIALGNRCIDCTKNNIIQDCRLAPLWRPSCLDP